MGYNECEYKTTHACPFSIYSRHSMSLSLQDPAVVGQFALGFLAGTAASVSNVPFDVAKSRIQAPQPPGHPDKYSTTLATIRTVYKEEGYASL